MDFKIDISVLFAIIPNTIIIAVFYYAFSRKIKDIVDDTIKNKERDLSELIEKLETRYEQRLVMMEAKLHSTEQNLSNTKEIVKTLETHNMHILKAVDDIKESITKLHERLDARGKI